MASNRNSYDNNKTQKAIRLLPVARTFASLDVSGPGAATFNTVIEAVNEGPAGNLITLATVADGTGAGSLTESGTAVTFHYQSGVTTVGNFETAVAGSTLIKVKTTGTGANVLNDPADTFSATNLSAGGATASAVPTLTSTTIGMAPPYTADQAVMLVRSVAGSGVMTATVRLWGFSDTTSTWYALGTGSTQGYLNGGAAIGEISTSSNNIAQVEGVSGIRRFSKFYAEIIGALGGTATEIEVWMDFVRAQVGTTN